MQDIVIVPTYDRPEMLWLCLDHLAASPDIYDGVQIWVVVDAHLGQNTHTSKEDIQAVIEKFPRLSLRIGYRPPHQFHGNSFNVLMAYRDAFNTKARYVYLVEDDVMVHPLFFAWHQRQHEKEIGASIAVVKEPFHSHYASWGVCFRRETLQLIVPHCQMAYFQNMSRYCRTRFPPSKIHCEQDGLFCRVLAHHKVVYATTPMAQHVGWYGYHRPKGVRPQGTLEERYQQVKQALVSVESLQNVVRDRFGDVHPLRI